MKLPAAAQSTKKQRIAFQKIYRVWFGIRLASAQKTQSRCGACLVSVGGGEGALTNNTHAHKATTKHKSGPQRAKASAVLLARLRANLGPACLPKRQLARDRLRPHVRTFAIAPAEPRLQLVTTMAASQETGQCCFFKIRSRIWQRLCALLFRPLAWLKNVIGDIVF